MHVVAVTRSGRPTAPELTDAFVPPSGLDTVLPLARALVLCCPMDENTRCLIGARALAKRPALKI